MMEVGVQNLWNIMKGIRDLLSSVLLSVRTCDTSYTVCKPYWMGAPKSSHVY